MESYRAPETMSRQNKLSIIILQLCHSDNILAVNDYLNLIRGRLFDQSINDKNMEPLSLGIEVIDNYLELVGELVKYAKLQKMDFTPGIVMSQKTLRNVFAEHAQLVSNQESRARMLEGGNALSPEFFASSQAQKARAQLSRTLGRLGEDNPLKVTNKMLDKLLGESKSKLFNMMAVALDMLESDLIIPVITAYAAMLDVTRLVLYRDGQTKITNFKTRADLDKFYKDFTDWTQAGGKVAEFIEGMQAVIQLMRRYCKIAESFPAALNLNSHKISSRYNKFKNHYFPESPKPHLHIADIYAIISLYKSIDILYFDRIKLGFSELRVEPRPVRGHKKQRSTSTNSFFAMDMITPEETALALTSPLAKSRKH